MFASNLNIKPHECATSETRLVRIFLLISQGIMVSSYLWGFLGDTQGRRIVILFSLFFSSAFTLLSAFVKSFTLFVICRFLTGVL
jgi:MFS family permease